MTFSKLFNNGLWRQNPSLVQLLGLCPLLAITSTLVNGLMLSLATTGVMLIANLLVALLRPWIPRGIRIPIFVMLIATLVTIVELAFNAWFHSLYQILGIFIPLITTNCIILARVEAFASREPVWPATLDALAMGLGLVWTLSLLSAMRELVAYGTLGQGIDLVVGHWQAWQVFPVDYHGAILAALPAGGFIFLGLLIAAKNWLEQLRTPAVPTLDASQLAREA